MGNEQRIDAFSAFRPFIRLLNIFDSANYQNSDQRLVIRNVCHASVFAILIFSLALTLVSDAWFCIGVKFDLSVSVLQLGLLINASQFAVTYISIRWRVQLINETIRNLNRMTNKRSKISESLFTSYEQLEERFFAWTKTTIKFSSCMITFVFVIPAMVPVAYVMFGTPPPHQWTTVYGFRCLALPSEMNVFFSYYMDWLNGLVSTVMYYIMLTTAALFFIGMCFYISEMARDLQASMAGYNEATPRQRMIDDIVFHQEILNVSISVRGIMSAGLFFQLLACAVTLAIYMLSAETSQVSSMDFCNAVLGTTLTLSSTYLYCYFSENVTYNLASIGQSFYQSDWYRLPPEQQKLAILSIQRAQREFRMTGLGLVDCSLRIFSSIIRATWSYYLFMHGFK